MLSASDVYPLLLWLDAHGQLIAEIALVIVLAPEFIRHRHGVKDNNLRIKLNLEIADPQKHTKPLYGLEPLLNQMEDILDRVRRPEVYASIKTGNELLIVGPAGSGKKVLAYHFAKRTGITRIITVHDPSDVDVLARANDAIKRQQKLWRVAARFVTRSELGKTMLLLPGLDHVDRDPNKPWPPQLEALIEAASTLSNVFVVGTAEKHHPKSQIGEWFGTTISFPTGDAWDTLMESIVKEYLADTIGKRYQLEPKLSMEDVAQEILKSAHSPAVVEDIVANCISAAILNSQSAKATHEQTDDANGVVITRKMLKTAINRSASAHSSYPNSSVY